jgi:hypothetical protein
VRVGGAFYLEPGELDLLATAALAAASAARCDDDVAALMLAELSVALRECVATGRVHVLRPVTPGGAQRLAERIAGRGDHPGRGQQCTRCGTAAHPDR